MTGTKTLLPDEQLASIVDAMDAAVAFGDAETALELADAALQIAPDDAGVLLAQAAVLDDLDRGADARDALERAAAGNVGDSEVWRRLGDVSLELGDTARAIDAYRRWQRLAGPSAISDAALAAAYLADLDIDRARHHLTASSEAGGCGLADELADLMDGLGDHAALAGVEAAAGSLLCSLGAVERGIELLEAAISRDDRPETRHRLGLILYLDGRIDAALPHLKAAASATADADRLVDLGVAQLADRDVDGAARTFDAASSIAPHDPRVRIGTGRVLLAQGDARKAIDSADAVLDDTPGSVDAWLLRARAHQAVGSPLAAQVCAEHAVAFDPDRRDLWLVLADLAEAGGHADLAHRCRARGSIRLTGSIGIAEGDDVAGPPSDIGAEVAELDALVADDERLRWIHGHRAVIADRLHLPRRALAYLDAAIERGLVGADEVRCDRGDLLASIGEDEAAHAEYAERRAVDLADPRARKGIAVLAARAAEATRPAETGPAGERPDTSTAATTTSQRTEVAWAPTHVAPPPGLSAYDRPSGEEGPVARLDGGLPVSLLERRGGWSRLRCENGWECWVDARLLVPVGGASAPTHRLPMHGLVGYAAPSTSPTEVARLDGGLAVELVSADGAWALVRFENGWTCWVDRSSLEPIT